MTLQSARAMAVQLNRVAHALEDDSWHPAIGAKAKQLASTAVRLDIGDMSMSGWPRKKPADILTGWKSESEVLAIRPLGRAAGPWRVLEDGRKSYKAGAARFRGARGPSKNRGAVSRITFTTRTVGATRGKKTWTTATELIGRITPRDITKAKIAAVRKAW